MRGAENVLCAYCYVLLIHRRRKQGFSKRLEHDLEIKRIQAAWKEYFETQKQLINWDDKKSDSKPKRAAKVWYPVFFNEKICTICFISYKLRIILSLIHSSQSKVYKLGIDY